MGGCSSAAHRHEPPLVVNIFVLFLIEKCVGLSILVEANLFLAIKLQPDLINRAILQVTSILRSKLKLK